MKKRGLMLLMLTAILGIQMTTTASASEQESGAVILTDQISPIIDKDGADPFVTMYGDQYLYTKTTGNNISIGIADSIQTLGAAQLQCIYKPGNELKDLWAPEIWYLDGKWYVYFAAVRPGEEMHYMFVLTNESENPLEGEWTCEPLQGMDDKFAIDGTIMELNGSRYFLWSGWEGYENVRQDIYLAELVSPVEVKEEKILLSLPELDWEKHGEPLINEGPEVVVSGDTVNLVYSASGSWTDDYCLGLLTMSSAEDPKNPENWTKQDTPVLSREGDVYGPGHNCFVIGTEGKESLNIYHAARWQGAGWNRSVRFGYVEFDEAGKILPMEGTSGEELITLPAGEAEVMICKGECENPSEFTLSSETDADVIVAVFARSDKQQQGSVARLALEVNGEKEIQELYASENLQPLYYHVSLKEGENAVKMYSIGGGAGNLEIARVELRK